MPTGPGLRQKVAAILERTRVTSRVVKFRSVARDNGNALLGIGQVHLFTETVVDPQPVVELVQTVTTTLQATGLAAGHSLAQQGDYRILFDGSLPQSNFTDQEILYGTDVLKIVSYEPIVFDATVVAWQVLARTVKTGS